SRPVPVYRSTAAMPTWTIQRAVRTVLDPLRPEDVPDPVPPEVRRRHRLRDLYSTWHDVHLPFGDGDWRRGQDRLRYEEALVLQTALARRRAAAAERPAVARPGAVA